MTDSTYLVPHLHCHDRLAHAYAPIPPLHQPHYHVDFRQGLVRTGIMILLSFVVYFLNYYINVLLARWFGPTNYGNFSVALSNASIFSCFVVLGHDDAVMRFLPQYLGKKAWSYAHGYLRHDFRLISSIGLVIIFISIACSILAFPSLRPEELQVEQYAAYHPTLYALWLIPLYGFSCYLSQLLSSLNRVFLATVPISLLSPLLTILLFWVLRAYIPINIYHACYIYGFVALAGVIYLLIACQMAIPKGILQSSTEYDIKKWDKFATKMMIGGTFDTILVSSSVIYLKAFGSHNDTVGFLSAILTITGIYWVLYGAMTTVFAPLFSAAASQSKDEAQKIINTYNWILWLALSILTIAFIIFKSDLLHCFGRSFIIGQTTLYIMVMGSFICIVLRGVPKYFLAFGGGQNSLVITSGITVALHFILSLILIHYFDYAGAACAYVGANIFYQTTLLVLFKRRFNLRALTVI